MASPLCVLSLHGAISYDTSHFRRYAASFMSPLLLLLGCCPPAPRAAAGNMLQCCTGESRLLGGCCRCEGCYPGGLLPQLLLSATRQQE